MSEIPKPLFKYLDLVHRLTVLNIMGFDEKNGLMDILFSYTKKEKLFGEKDGEG